MKVVRQDELPEELANHETPIRKKVFIRNGEIPILTNFSTSVFEPGQKTETHKHDTMFEVFYVQSGQMEFTINGETSLLKKGDCITIAPKEMHAQNNPFKEDVVLLYFGVATD